MIPEIPESKKFTQIASEVESIRDCLRGAVLAIEVERASVGKTDTDFDEDLQAILGLGVLLGDLQHRRVRATELSATLPSPNRLSAKMGAESVRLGKLLFETIAHIRNIQSEIYRLARLNLRSASHKINHADRMSTQKSVRKMAIA